MINYERYADSVLEKFTKYGTTLKFYFKVDGQRDITTGKTTYTELIAETKGLVSNFDTLFIDDTNIIRGDKQVLISTEIGRPTIGDKVLINDTQHTIINIQELRPADVTLLYKLHVRSYAIGTGVEGIFMSIGSLDLGTVLIDPNKEDSPEWMIIAHNHHKIGLTTLISKKVWTTVSFNGTPEKGIARSTTPWSYTYLREWLSTEFAKSLSSKLISNVKPVLIETGSEKITDTYTALSKVELGGPPAVGRRDGKAIPYFESDSLRIAEYENPSKNTVENTEYWTRDWNGVGADGKFKTYSAAAKHGVRPVIFLPTTINASYNYTNEYELAFE